MKLRIKTPSLRVWAFLGAALASTILLCYRLRSLVLHLILYVEEPLGSVMNYVYRGYHDPLLLPGTLSRLFVSAVSPYHNVLTARIPSVLIGLLTLGMMYWLQRR